MEYLPIKVWLDRVVITQGYSRTFVMDSLDQNQKSERQVHTEFFQSINMSGSLGSTPEGATQYTETTVYSVLALPVLVFSSALFGPPFPHDLTI